MGFITDDFMLKGKTAKILYHEYAENQPIIDYHCHLSPELIAKDYKFRNAYDLFLSGDHYKWRLMRAAGVDEKLITGDGDEYDKFAAFAGVVPLAIGNPMYHWTHLELKRYFDIDEPLCAGNARRVWDCIGEKLSDGRYSARGLIKMSGVETLCTTDDPADTLALHEQMKDFSVKVLPAFRPDRFLNISSPQFADVMRAAGIKDMSALKEYLLARAQYFADHGCRLADHSLTTVPFNPAGAEEAFQKRLNGQMPDSMEEEAYKTEILLFLSSVYTRLNWTMQLHFGALRNNNPVMYAQLGADSGFDSIGDACRADKLAALMGAMQQQNTLPRTILYSLNGGDNYMLAAMAGNFQCAPYYGKIQLGAGWWFNDNRDGMESQLKALANVGLLPSFVGMLTDSRSFVSYTRHEYFRRIFCNLIGKWVDDGEYPFDKNLLGGMVKDVCYRNAKNYFGF